MIIWLTIVSVVLFGFAILLLLVMGCLGRQIVELRELKEQYQKFHELAGKLIETDKHINNCLTALIQGDKVAAQRIQALEQQLTPFDEALN